MTFSHFLEAECKSNVKEISTACELCIFMAASHSSEDALLGEALLFFFQPHRPYGLLIFFCGQLIPRPLLSFGCLVKPTIFSS